MKRKKIIFFAFMLFTITSFCFSAPKYYRSKDGYNGYAEMHYQGMNGEWTIQGINNNLFIISNAFGYFPNRKDKLSNAQWALFWAAYDDQYDVKKNEIYNIKIKVSGDSSVLIMTFYDDGKYINWYAFSDYSVFP